jgi:arylsulfatase A-like enzyme
LLGVAGLRPREPKPGLDLTPVMSGAVDDLDREGVLLEFVGELRPGLPFHDETWRGVRTRHGKYTVLGDARGARPWQYFDLGADPYELHNRVDDPACAEEVARPHRLLRELLVSSTDHYVLAPAHGCPGLNEWDPEAAHQRRFG